MKYEVKLYVGGKVFTESVEAVNQQNARETASAQESNSKSYWSQCKVLVTGLLKLSL
jgi:hypothetical protein